MKKQAIIFLLLLFPMLSFAQVSSDLQQDMQSMAVLWNNGNIREFVTYYKNSPETLYISKTVIHGYDGILKRYLNTFPTQADRGKLSFSNLEIKSLSEKYAVVIGKWNLERPTKGNIGGIFTLIFENTTSGWKIIVDHTS